MLNIRVGYVFCVNVPESEKVVPLEERIFIVDKKYLALIYYNENNNPEGLQIANHNNNINLPDKYISCDIKDFVTEEKYKLLLVEKRLETNKNGKLKKNKL